MVKSTLLIADGTDDFLAELPYYARHYVPFSVGVFLRPETDIDLLVCATGKISVPILVASRDLGTLHERVLSVVNATPEITNAALISDSTDWIPLLATLRKEGFFIHLVASQVTDLFLHADTIGTRNEKDETIEDKTKSGGWSCRSGNHWSTDG